MISLRYSLKKIGRLLYRNLDKHIFFLHVPKCGGQSIVHGIKKYYPFANIRILTIPSFNSVKVVYRLSKPEANDHYYVYKFRENLLVYFMNQNIPFISGHVSFDEVTYRHFHTIYNYITLLRDPVKRWISNYFYNRYKTQDDYCRTEEDITAFLHSEQAKSFGHEYVKIIGGLDETGDYTSKQAILRAKENLHKFEIVGCLECLGDFLKQFEECFGMKLNIPKRNENPKSQAYIQSVITQDVEKEIVHLCQPDIEVYQYALDTFLKKN